MGRKRIRLVPSNCVEAFQVRCVLYFDTDGLAMVSYSVDQDEHAGSDQIPIHEVLGVMSYAMSAMIAEHEARIKEEET